MHAALTVKVTKEAASSSHDWRADGVGAASVCLLSGASCLRIIRVPLASMLRRACKGRSPFWAPGRSTTLIAQSPLMCRAQLTRTRLEIDEKCLISKLDAGTAQYCAATSFACRGRRRVQISIDQRGLRLSPERPRNLADRRGDGVLRIGPGSRCMQVPIDLTLRVTLDAGRQRRQPRRDAFRHVAMQTLPVAARRSEVERLLPVPPRVPQLIAQQPGCRDVDPGARQGNAVNVTSASARHQAGADIVGDRSRIALERSAEAATAAAPDPDDLE